MTIVILIDFSTVIWLLTWLLYALICYHAVVMNGDFFLRLVTELKKGRQIGQRNH
jgi:hypothetical protein